MSYKMRALGRKKRCHYADSIVHKTTNTDWLQGGLMSVIIGKISGLMQHQKVKIDYLGRCIAQRASNEKKMLIIITICRIPQGTNQGMKLIISQYNQMNVKMNSATNYRKEHFKHMID